MWTVRLIRSCVTAMLLLEPPELAAARSLAAAFVALERTLGWPHVGDCADGFALIAALEGRFDAAARLAGFADRVYIGGDPRDPVSAAACARVAALLAGARDAAALEAARTSGATLAPEAAAALALAP